MELHLLSKDTLDDVVRCCKLSFFSPFEASDAPYSKQCRRMYQEAAEQALKDLRTMQINN